MVSAPPGGHVVAIMALTLVSNLGFPGTSSLLWIESGPLTGAQESRGGCSPGGSRFVRSHGFRVLRNVGDEDIDLERARGDGHTPPQN